MAPNLTKEKKLKIIRALIRNPSIFSGKEGNGIIDLLDYVFNLRAMKSEDPRFDDAYGDAVQHLINNSDWELEYILLTRFDLTEGDKIFKMLEYLVRPDFQSQEQRRLDLADEINSSLNKEGYTLLTSEFNESDQPIFSISEYNPNTKYPAGVIKNTIKFYPNYEDPDLNKIGATERDFFESFAMIKVAMRYLG